MQTLYRMDDPWYKLRYYIYSCELYLYFRDPFRTIKGS